MSENKKIAMDHVTIIVPLGRGKDVLALAKMKGIPSGTVSVGTGTANKELLAKLESHDLKRDVVSLVTATDLAEIFLKELYEKFSLGKPGHGIAYSTNINEVYTEFMGNVDSLERNKGEFEVITAIIRNGTADTLMEAARGAGARGGTILEPSEMEAANSLFSKDTEGSDDVVIIIARDETVRPIMEAINNALDSKKALIYLQDAHFVYGLK